MNRFGISSLVAVVLGLSAFIVLSFVQLPAHGQGKAVSSGQGQPLPTRHVREAVSRGQAARAGRLPATQSLKLSIALPLRNESQLDQVLQQLYDPRSPSYHQFFSVKEFTEQFGPSQEDYDAVISFAQSNGLTVRGTAANRRIVDVTGPVAHIEAAFHVNMGVYQHPTENRTFYAPDREPTADLPVALWHISGLDNFSIPRPASLRRLRKRSVRPRPRARAREPAGLISAATCGRPTTVEQPLPAAARRSGCWHLELGSAAYQVTSPTIST